MKVSISFYDLNKFLTAANTGVTINGISDDVFELAYNPGALLPNVNLKLRKCGFDSGYVPFRYEAVGVSSFMLSAADFFSILPEGFVIDKAAQTIAIVPSKLSALSSFNGNCYFRYLNIYKDRIEFSLFAV